MQISPYVVVRRCRLRAGDLGFFRMDRLWAHIDETRRLREQVARLAATLSDALAEAVGRAEGTTRTHVVVLRRDVHNARTARVRERLEAGVAGVGDPTVARVREWCDRSEELTRREAEMRQVFSQERSRVTARLGQIVADDAVERSLQLSGEQLYRDIKRLTDPGAKRLKASKERIRETALVNFSYRAATKPSPFGRFVEIGAFPPDGPRPPLPRHRAPRESSVRLSRVLLNWLLACLPRVPGGIRSGHLVLSSTCTVRDGRVRYAGTLPGAAAPGRIGREGVVNLGEDPRIRAIVDLLDDGRPVPGTKVLAAVPAGQGPEDAEQVVLALIGAGLLFFRPDADDHDPEYARHVEDLLAQGETPQLRSIHRSFGALRDLELDFAAADAERRLAMLDRARAAVRAIAEECGVPAPPDDIMKALVYEDLPAEPASPTWDLGVVERSRPALRALWRLADVLDPRQVRRLGLLGFTQELLAGRESVPFLEFFGALSRLDDDELATVVSGRREPRAERFGAQRDRALARIRDSLREQDGVAHLDPSAVHAALDEVDELRETASILFRTQFARTGEDDRDRLVVNGVLTGYGVYVSRFGTFLGDDAGWSLAGAQRDHLARRFPGQADLNSVLGFNFNLHPRVTDTVVDYPGAVSCGDRLRVLRPADLEVRVDASRGAVHLWDPREHRDVPLVPMNFMTPYGVPLLYRVLEALTPSNRYTWNPYADLMRRDPDDERPTPRLLVGDVVADRRSWNVPAHEFPYLDEISKDDVGALDRFDAWRQERGLPQRAFVLCQTRDERLVMAGRGGAESRSLAYHAHLRRASVHKPMYVDFRNPYLARSFSKSALSREGVVVTIRECVPDPEAPGESGEHRPVEEHLVEFNAE